MSDPKHTRGLLSVQNMGENIWVMHEEDYLATMVTSDDEGHYKPIEEVEANAQLFAAAPDMDKLLREFLYTWKEEMDEDLPINGGDMVEYVCKWYQRVKEVMNNG